MKYCNLPSAPRLLPKNVVPEIRDDTLNIWWSRGNDVKIDNYTIFYCTEERDKSIIGCGIVRGKQKLHNVFTSTVYFSICSRGVFKK